MAESIKINQTQEKVILVGVSFHEGDDTQDSMIELAELVETAGAEVVGMAVQGRDSIHPNDFRLAGHGDCL